MGDVTPHCEKGETRQRDFNDDSISSEWLRLTALISTRMVLQTQLPDQDTTSLINAGGPPQTFPVGIVFRTLRCLP